LKLALVHDWLDTWGGAENVLAELRAMFPDAPLFTLVDFLEPAQRGRLGPAPIHVSAIARLPRARRHFRKYLPWFPAAMRRFDLADYDVILSNSHAVAKFARAGPNGLHLCYCHTPMRYAWDLREQYLAETGIASGVAGVAARAILARLRRQDVAANSGVDSFIANSGFIAERIRRCYDRDSEVIYPPVDTDQFEPGTAGPGEHYLTVSRLVPYKRVDAIVAAFRQMPDRRLIVVGGGPALEDMRATAPSNVEIAGPLPGLRMLAMLQSARAFVFAAEEDFGIAPLEAQACGVPVIALGRGGVFETVVGAPAPNATGVFFPEVAVEAIVQAVRRFESGPVLSRENCRANAIRFGRARFREEFREFVEVRWGAHLGGTQQAGASLAAST
jgi:glycosyltransferase involved in cell wall biosynthesis